MLIIIGVLVIHTQPSSLSRTPVASSEQQSCRGFFSPWWCRRRRRWLAHLCQLNQNRLRICSWTSWNRSGPWTAHAQAVWESAQRQRSTCFYKGNGRVLCTGRVTHLKNAWDFTYILDGVAECSQRFFWDFLHSCLPRGQTESHLCELPLGHPHPHVVVHDLFHHSWLKKGKITCTGCRNNTSAANFLWLYSWHQSNV